MAKSDSNVRPMGQGRKTQPHAKAEIFNEDGTIKGIIFGKPSTTRGVVLVVAIRKGQPDGIHTSFAAGQHFREAYKKAVNAVVQAHHIVDKKLIKLMHASIDAFLIKHNMKLVLVQQEVLEINPH